MMCALVTLGVDKGFLSVPLVLSFLMKFSKLVRVKGGKFFDVITLIFS